MGNLLQGEPVVKNFNGKSRVADSGVRIVLWGEYYG